MKVYFKWLRETKGANVYMEVNAQGEELNAQNGAVIGSLYIRKSAKADPPKEIEFDLPID